MNQRRRLYTAVGAVILTAVLAFLRINTRRIEQLSRSAERHVVGAFHLHSADSHDSAVPIDAYAAAANVAGLDFIVITDHNTQKPHASVAHDVIVLSYAEMSSKFGHVMGLGTDALLEREAADTNAVHSNFRKLHGMSIVAHPTDPKRPWTGNWDDAGGLEIANLSASARRRAKPLFFGLLPELLTWSVHRDLAFVQIYDRDDAALALWDSNPEPSFLGFCGDDAHGWIDLSLNLRGWNMVMENPLLSPEAPALALLDEMQRGHFYCVAGMFGRNPDFKFAARRNNMWVAQPGDTICRDQVEQLVVRGPSRSRGKNQIFLLRNGVEVTRTLESTLLYADPQPGTYRVEIRTAVPNLLFGDRWLPVIYSNRIRIVPPPPQLPPTLPGLPNAPGAP